MKTSTLMLTVSLFAASFAQAGEPGFFKDAKAPIKIKPIVDAKAPIIDAKAPIVKHECLSYDFIDLEYGFFDTDDALGADADTDVYSASFSKSLGSLLYLTGGYTNTQIDGGNYYFNDLEAHTYELGIGARWALRDCLHLTLEGGARHTDNRFDDYPGLNNDTWGWYLAPGLRARKGRLEGFVRAEWSEFENSGGNWVFNPGALYHINDTVAFKVEGFFGDDDLTGVTLGARIHF